MSGNRAYPSAEVLRIVIVDKHTIFRAGLCSLLEKEDGIRVVGEADNLTAARKLIHREHPHVLLIDLDAIEFPEDNLLSRIASAGYSNRTLVLIAADRKDDLGLAIRMGAGGFVWKNLGVDLLIKAIRSVGNGAFWMGHEAVEEFDSTSPPRIRDEKARTRNFGLTRREMEIVENIAAGHSNREIARRLSISEDTVKHHLTNIYDKVGVYNRLELALFAIHHSLIRKQGAAE
jgi:two-component system, NarL family, nitrate/nitrite response regulator NarL